MRHLDHSLPALFRERTLTRVRKLRLSALIAFLCVAVTAPGASGVNAQEQFGTVHFLVTCNAGVQKKFDLALAMLHAFSFPEAAKTFMAVAGEDPDCAMAYWGVAATAIGSLYGGRPGPMALQGSGAVERAKAVGGKTPRERDYIATLDVFYGVRTRSTTSRGRVPTPMPWSSSIASIPMIVKPRSSSRMLCPPSGHRPT
jgi:hypothetical protein